MGKKNVAIFASGSGSNARNMIRYFRNHQEISVSLIVCNKPGAGVLQVAEEEDVEAVVIRRHEFYQTDSVKNLLLSRNISLVVLAGFLWMIPHNLLDEFKGRMVNIHPSLLPKYGGFGMYGLRVHEAVLQNGEKESGITIHYVNDRYDEGEIIFQKALPVNSGDTAGSLAERIHALEYEWYPKVVEQILTSSPAS